MIESFKHKGLKRLYERGDQSKINANHLSKVKRILAQLDAAETVDHMDLPGYGLHPLHGDLQGFYAVSVSGNWRIVFKFEVGKASDIDLVDYH
jgi:toxin HigB-1